MTNASTDRSAPLQGVRVVDLTSVVVGPACTARLVSYGAEVIKVEGPGGDVMRSLGGASPTGQHSGAYLHFNAGKRNLGLDLKHPMSSTVMTRLLAWADVVITNVRPEALERLNLDAATVRRDHPQVIHCLISGYGTDGPYAGMPTYDSVVQGVAGIAALAERRDGTPAYVPLLLCDHVTGEIAAGAIVAALLQRDRTGEGAAIEVPMFETMAAFVLQEHLARASFDPPVGPPGDPRLLTPHNRPVQTADGWLSVTVNTDDQVRAFLTRTDRSELVDDPRFASPSGRGRHQVEWLEVRSQPLTQRTTAEWLALLQTADVPAQPCHTLESLLEDPHLMTVELLGQAQHETEGTVTTIRSTISFDGQRQAPGDPAQPRGAGSRLVLAMLGFSDVETADLVSSGAVQVPEL
jgi:crotonobetainyl-CoA:carnitine CoA-transferase CaiB-like acyl-CoA transferase